jgi:hypothetical protein
VSLPKVLDGKQRQIPTRREFDWDDEVTNLLADVCDLLESVKTITKLSVRRIAAPFQAVVATAGTTALDFSGGYNLRITLQASTTFSFLNARDGERYILELIQDASGNRLVTWPASVDWGGITPTLSNSPSKVDLVCLLYDASAGKYRAELRTGYG